VPIKIPQTFSRTDVQVDSIEILHEGFLKVRKVHLRHKLFRGDWSGTIDRETSLRRDAVGVLLFDSVLQKIALVEQFRIGAFMRENAEPWLLELVAGLIEVEESPEDVAIRESLEEAGCVVTKLEPVHGYFSSPGGGNEYFHLFLGYTDLSAAGGVHGLAEENEDIQVHVIDCGDIPELLQSARINNAHTLIALQWFMLNKSTSN
jgi:ADP-ribose pyrophosphatase